LGNRHIGKNVTILLVNNGKGTEFRQCGHVSSSFGDELDEFVAA
jgi:2-succinyl-5-enolpyruvyl-6-hydroxy-3-cyclohexene-1-carboxylate synthase